MKFHQLGGTDLQVSAVGLGCNNFGRRIDLEQTRRVVDKAIDLGINLFDTADVYGAGKSEEFLGELLGSRRKQIVLATKFGHPMDDSGTRQGASAAYIVRAVEDSLRRLKTDVIDLYQLHTPDPKTPMEETLGALDGLVKAGKVRHIGCSNVPAWQVADSRWIAKTKSLAPFITCQDEYSLLHRDPERELLPMCAHFGMSLLPYFPLASGLLTGKYTQGQAAPEGTRYNASPAFADRYMTESNWAKIRALTAFAQDRGHSLLDLAFGWLLSKPQTASVIAGATKPEQLEANVKAGAWVLSEEESAKVADILQTS